MDNKEWITAWKAKFNKWLKTNASCLQQGEMKSERKSFADWLKFCTNSSVAELQDIAATVEQMIAFAGTDSTYATCRQHFVDAARDQLTQRRYA